MSVKRLVIDSSVALKWRLRDEEATSQADALLGDFLSGALDLSKGLWVYTGDRKLFNATKDLLPWVRWIGDYQFDTIPVTTSRTPSPDLPQTE